MKVLKTITRPVLSLISVQRRINVLYWIRDHIQDTEKRAQLSAQIEDLMKHPAAAGYIKPE